MRKFGADWLFSLSKIPPVASEMCQLNSGSSFKYSHLYEAGLFDFVVQGYVKMHIAPTIRQKVAKVNTFVKVFALASQNIEIIFTCPTSQELKCQNYGIRRDTSAFT